MSHTHTFHLETHLVLTLPDRDGYQDRLLQYGCACGEHLDIAGSFCIHSSAFTLEDLLTCLTRERREGTTLAKVAQREHAHRPRPRISARGVPR